MSQKANCFYDWLSGWHLDLYPQNGSYEWCLMGFYLTWKEFFVCKPEKILVLLTGDAISQLYSFLMKCLHRRQVDWDCT